MDESAKKAIREVVDSNGRVVVLTGAGISAESGIPTYRGPEGYWTVGSRNYRPEEMATFAMFSRHPQEVWQWYLYRIGVYREAQPNTGHLAVVEMEERLGDRFLLITQNVDGMHQRAGNSPERTYQIHGHIETIRCTRGCTRETWPLPEVRVKEKDEPIRPADLDLLRCPGCGEVRRPHVLWFDECYNEEYFHFDSSIRAASKADLLLVVGTSGATNLPMHVGAIVAERGALIVDINPDPNPFSALATQVGGFYLPGLAGTVLPELVAAMFV